LATKKNENKRITLIDKHGATKLFFMIDNATYDELNSSTLTCSLKDIKDYGARKAETARKTFADDFFKELNVLRVRVGVASIFQQATDRDNKMCKQGELMMWKKIWEHFKKWLEEKQKAGVK